MTTSGAIYIICRAPPFFKVVTSSSFSLHRRLSHTFTQSFTLAQTSRLPRSLSRRARVRRPWYSRRRREFRAIVLSPQRTANDSYPPMTYKSFTSDRKFHLVSLLKHYYTILLPSFSGLRGLSDKIVTRYIIMTISNRMFVVTDSESVAISEALKEGA